MNRRLLIFAAMIAVALLGPGASAAWAAAVTLPIPFLPFESDRILLQAGLSAWPDHEIE